MFRAVTVLAVVAFATSCSSGRKPDIEAPKILELISPDFSDTIPVTYTGVPPKLMWTGTPEGTKELALIVDDPDAPTPEPYVHYVLTRIAPRGAPPESIVGKNENGKTAWDALDPPPGETHRYHFRIYALDIALGDQPKSKAEVLAAIKGHVLGWGEMVAKYGKK